MNRRCIRVLSNPSEVDCPARPSCHQYRLKCLSEASVPGKSAYLAIPTISSTLSSCALAREGEHRSCRKSGGSVSERDWGIQKGERGG